MPPSDRNCNVGYKDASWFALVSSRDGASLELVRRFVNERMVAIAAQEGRLAFLERSTTLGIKLQRSPGQKFPSGSSSRSLVSPREVLGNEMSYGGGQLGPARKGELSKVTDGRLFGHRETADLRPSLQGGKESLPT